MYKGYAAVSHTPITLDVQRVAVGLLLIQVKTCDSLIRLHLSTCMCISIYMYMYYMVYGLPFRIFSYT